MAIAIVGSRETVHDTDVTNHACLLPDGSNVTGYLVMAAFFCDENPPSITWPAGWTVMFTEGNTGVHVSVAYRFIDGTEGFDGTNDTITVTTGNAQQSYAHIRTIEGADESTPPEIDLSDGSTNDSEPDPPPLTPTWGVDTNVWIIGCAMRFNDAVTAAPSGYEGLISSGLGGDDSAPSASAHRILAAATEDPGTFTLLANDSLQWLAFTFAARQAPNGEDQQIVDVDLAVETETAHSVTVHKTAPLTRAVETEVALNVDAKLVRYVELGQAAETEEAQEVRPGIPVALGQAVEVETALAINTPAGITLGQAIETETAHPITHRKTAHLEQTVDTETALEVRAARTKALGRATETETGHAFDLYRVALLGQAVENESAMVVAPPSPGAEEFTVLIMPTRSRERVVVNSTQQRGVAAVFTTRSRAAATTLGNTRRRSSVEPQGATRQSIVTVPVTRRDERV